MVCAAQCLLLPISALVVPVIATLPIADEWFHSMLLFFVVPVSTFAMFLGCRKHKSYNIFIYGFVFTIGCLIIGFLLAVLIDQKIRGESLFRTIFLYPYAMSFVVTGLVWKWVLNPTFGIEHSMHLWGFDWFKLDWLVNRELAIYAVCIAAVWQGAGFVMVLMLAGLRGIDEDIWKSLSIEGVPKWKSYLFVILPMIRPMVITALVLIAAGVVKVYDLILALTSGGPGFATTTPAMYVMENFFSRANLGQAFAASIIMFVSVVCILAPWAYYEFYFRNREVKS